MDIIPSSLGSEHEFMALVWQQMPALRHWLRQYLKSKDDQDDVLQATMIAAWIGYKHFTPYVHIRIWLQRIAKRQMLNWLRSEQRKGRLHPLRVMLDEEEHDRGENAEFLEILHADLSRLLAILPIDTQRLIFSIYIAGYSYVEIAEDRGSSVSSLKMKVKRGIEEMREVVKEEERRLNKGK